MANDWRFILCNGDSLCKPRRLTRRDAVGLGSVQVRSHNGGVAPFFAVVSYDDDFDIESLAAYLHLAAGAGRAAGGAREIPGRQDKWRFSRAECPSLAGGPNRTVG